MAKLLSLKRLPQSPVANMSSSAVSKHDVRTRRWIHSPSLPFVRTPSSLASATKRRTLPCLLK